MGIPIDGSYASFVAQLKAKGFKETSVGGADLEGQFSGSNRTVYVYCTPITEKVYRVTVTLHKSSSWSSLKSIYSEFKELLTNKYGEPFGGETFTQPYYEGDGYEMTALLADKCNYTQIYSTESGRIMLWISKVFDGSVLLMYNDNINSDLNDAEQSSIKYNDL